MNRASCRLVTGIALAAGLPASPLAAQEVPDDALVITLLGTGRPGPGEGRRGFSSLVQAGGPSLIFDAGRAATKSLAGRGVPAGRIHAVFPTPHPSDHVEGLAVQSRMVRLPGPARLVAAARDRHARTQDLFRPARPGRGPDAVPVGGRRAVDPGRGQRNRFVPAAPQGGTRA